MILSFNGRNPLQLGSRSEFSIFDLSMSDWNVDGQGPEYDYEDNSHNTNNDDVISDE